MKECIMSFLMIETESDWLMISMRSISWAQHSYDMVSSGSGTLSKINPLVTVKRNQKLKFDLSDPSLSFGNGNTYSGFEMNLFEDLNYVNEFVTSGQTREFEVTKTGKAWFGL